MDKDHQFESLKRIFKIDVENKKEEKLKEENKNSTKNKTPKNNNREVLKLDDKSLVIPKVLRSEFNFLKYPFFDLAKTSKRDKIEIREKITNEEGSVEIYWKVSRHVDSSFPSAFDKKLHRAIEQIINKLERPIQNPVNLGSLRSLCKLMNVSPGKNTQMIRESLKRLVLVGIEAKGTFYLKSKKQYIDDTFHLYDRIIFTGEELPDGREADGVYLILGSFYLQNINSNYVVPLDWNYYQNLEGNITTRMYEYLGLSFYAALEKSNRFVQIKYSKLCDYFPLIRQDELWKAKKQLRQSHEILVKTGYFSKQPEWTDSQKKKDWIIRYWIGQRAKDEWKKNKSRFAEIGRSEADLLSRPPEEERPELVEKLIERGVSEKAADRLYKNHHDRIEIQIEYFDYLKETKNDMISKNPGGFLRKSIEEDYSPPAGYISKEEKERIEKTNRERDERFKRQKKIEEYKEWLERLKEPQKCVSWDLHNWVKEYENKNGKPPSQEQIEQKEKELIENLPTKEELQKRIFGEVIDDQKLDLFSENI